MHNASIPRSTLILQLASGLVALYAWIVTVSFGAVLLDVVYSRSIPGAAAAFSEVSDLLLLIGAVTVFAALGAIAVAWTSSATRNLLIASLIFIAFGLFAPLLLAPFLKGGDPALGMGIRLVLSGLPSVFAFSGLYRLHRSG